MARQARAPAGGAPAALRAAPAPCSFAASGSFSSRERRKPGMGRARLHLAMRTERPSPRYSAIDLWEPAEILDAMLEGQFAAVAAVYAARPALERAALGIEARLRGGGRLVYAGAGTSGRLAVQDGAELMPTFSWPAERLLLLIAGGNEALIRAVEGAEDQSEHALALIKSHN